MTTRLAPRGAVALLAVLVCAALWAAVPAVAADPADCDGVWVVVDAAEVAGAVSVSCVTGEVDSGLDALAAAGHTATFVPGIAGMVCTIDEVPDPCNRAPADAYWSYWHATDGDEEWTYARVGAGTRAPAPGDVEGWRFGDGRAPPQPLPPAVAEAAAATARPAASTSNAARTSGPGGAALGIGLLVGVGALTGWERRRRQAGGP